jgi:hypothetical protein
VVGGAKLLGWWDLNVSHRYQQGRSYPWNPDGLERLEGVYNRRTVPYNRTDIHLEKRFQLAGINAGAFLAITNFFNVKNLNQVMNYSSDRPRFDRLVAREDRGNTSDYEIAYMDALDAEGKKFGEETENFDELPLRLYYLWDVPRDYWLGLKLYF